MEGNELSKSNKLKIIIITALIFLVAIAGISYAYFSIQIVGNDTASSMRLTTANMSLEYNDVSIVSGSNVTPGWSQTKTLTVTNTGNVASDYIIKFRELQNTIINGELVMSATCTASTGSCSALPESAIHSASSQITDAYMYGPISIPAGVTHTYTVTIEFKETGSNQNYNQNKSFIGTLNIGDGTADESLFNYTVSNDEVTITGYRALSATVSDQTSCQNTATYMLQQSPYNLASETASAAAGVLCSGGSVQGLSLQEAVINGDITPEYYQDLGLTVQATRPDVIIPSTIDGNPVTTMGEGVFAFNGLTSVVIPNSVTTIGVSAFYNNQLTSVVIPSSVTIIGEYAFRNNQLTSVVIPNSVTTIGSWAFNNNQLPDSQAFTYKRTDTNNDGIAEIDYTTIIGYGGSNKNVMIPDGVIIIDESAFRNNQLTSVIIPNSVTTIGDAAFDECFLSSVTLGASVQTIGSSAFWGAPLTSVVIPSSVTAIGGTAFGGGYQLTSVTIEGKSSSSDFTSYPSPSPWDWASGYSDSNIVWTGSGS